MQYMGCTYKNHSLFIRNSDLIGCPIFYLATLSTVQAPIDLLEQSSDMELRTGSFFLY